MAKTRDYDKNSFYCEVRAGVDFEKHKMLADFLPILLHISRRIVSEIQTRLQPRADVVDLSGITCQEALPLNVLLHRFSGAAKVVFERNELTPGSTPDLVKRRCVL